MRGTWALGAADFSISTVILIALVATAGALLIHWLRGGNSRQAVARHEGPSRREAVPVVVPKSPHDPSLPDWSKPEPVMFDEAHLVQMMRDYAARAGIPERVLPKADLPHGGDGNFVFRDKFGYVYAIWEGGRQTQEQTSVVADQLLYWVFRDRAWMHSYIETVGADLAEADRTRKVENEQERLLGLIDPKWAAQLRHDRKFADRGGAGQD